MQRPLLFNPEFIFMASHSKHEPIAIVGIGCRLPGGASDVDKFWDLLINKTDAIRTVPVDRWDLRKFYNPDQDVRHDKMATTQGGFLQEKVDTFDPDFFEISHREARVMDPQQRLLMEVSYEAIEDAGFSLGDLSGSNTGVFIGGFTFDYTILQLDRQSRHLLNPSGATGSMLTMISNKLSYLYNLKGPSLTIDTACSSSLVAAHYACKEIWAGECDMAMVGGVNLILIPAVSIVMSTGKFLSRDGRCRTFDKNASGYVRGEGAAVVMLKRLDKALEDGDKIYALIKSTGVNQDGRTNGITTPNYESQKALIKKVYDEADIDINQLHYIEAHGTGTQAGDPIEFKSLNHALSEKGYQRDKCLVGSVKTNIGHLEAGAGVTGLIKAALCLKHKKVPPNLHFQTPNPSLQYEDSRLRVPSEVEELPQGKASLASVNSFGYGGTNAHVLLEEFIAQPNGHARKTPSKKDSYFIFPLSAAGPDALRELAKTYIAFLNGSSHPLQDILFSALFRRTHLRHRLAIAARSGEELVEKLGDFVAGNPVKEVVVNEKLQHPLKTVFVFTGMGPQWWKMGRELYGSEPVFRDALNDCDELFRKIAGWSVIEEMMKDEEASNIKDTQIAQPANFFIQYGLTVLLETFGVSADAYIGHSVGEVSSAYFSGALTLKEALIVAYHRSRLQSRAAGMGAMLAVSLNKEDAAPYLDRYEGISVAAINSPGSVTLAGNEDSLAAISEELNLQGIFNKVLEVEVPYHSPLMDGIKEELLDVLAKISPKPTTKDLYSTVTGHKIDGTAIDNDYWWKNVRNPVNFVGAVDQLSEDGYKLFIEIGPHPVLKNSILECLNQKEYKATLLHFMNRKEAEQVHFYSQLGALFTLGYPVRFDKFAPKGKLVDLPKYCWQRSVFWNESKASRQDRVGGNGSLFLNHRLSNFNPSYEVELTGNFFPFIKDHIVQGKIIFPGAGYIASAIAMGEKDIAEDGQIITMEDIVFHQLLFINDKRSQYLNTNFHPKTNQFQIFSRMEDEVSEQWQLHASGRIAQSGLAQLKTSIDLAAIRNQCITRIGPADFYEKLRKMKLEYGDLFRGVRCVYTDGNEVLAEIVAPEGLDDNPYFIHPSLLDACFQALVALSPEKEVVPVSIRKIHCIKPAGKNFFCYGTGVVNGENGMFADIYICDQEGNICIIIEGFECKELLLGDTIQLQETDLFYFPAWEKLKVPAGKTAKEDTVFYIYAPNPAISHSVYKQLSAYGAEAYSLLPAGDDTGNVPATDIESATDLEKLQEHMLAHGRPVRLLYIAGSTEAGDNLLTAYDCYTQLDPLIRLARGMSRITAAIDIITGATQQVLDTDTCSNLSAFSLWGFGHVISNEFTHLSVRHIDLEKANGPDGALPYLPADLLFRYRDETDLAIRGNEVYGKRMRKKEAAEKEELTVKTNTSAASVSLDYKEGSGIRSLVFKEIDRAAPGRNELEVRITDVSINFKDYLKVAGLISRKATEETFFDTHIGMDCAGVVTRTGEGVQDFKPGDRIMGMAAAGAFRSYVNISEDMVYHAPAALKDHYPSHTMIVFCTVLRCLRDIANLRKGEKILIHNAAGGVGIAAIQYARHVGAEVYATTSRPEKAEYLRSIGLKNVYSLRQLEFVSGIRTDTGGYGVDVVISSLPGETLHQSIALLAPYGRYIEIGKKDIVENAGLPLQFFGKNLSFSSMDFDKFLKERSALVKGYFKDIHDYFEQGIFQPLPLSVFPAEQIRDAFGLIEKGQHVGKVVVDMDNQELEMIPAKRTTDLSSSTCLITGGTQGLGLQLAKWLATKGARNIVLVSRSGLAPDIEQDVLDYFTRQNVTLRVEKADISDRQRVQEVVDGIAEDMLPLGLVIHCAMVLDDGLLADLTKERFLKVMKPKIDGALNLHHALAGSHPAHFICISSISSLVGNPGQGNYVAANAFLDGFAFYRTAQGLPCTTLNLGVLLETGVVQRDKNLQTILESVGIRGFTNKQLLKGFDSLLDEPVPQAGFFDIDWALWAANNKKASGISLFKEYIQSGEQKQNANPEQAALIKQLREMETPERHAATVSILTQMLSEILRMPAQNINPERGINLLGIDSVMVVELINVITKKFGVAMAPMEFLSGPTVNDIASSLLSRLF